MATHTYVEILTARSTDLHGTAKELERLVNGSLNDLEADGCTIVSVATQHIVSGTSQAVHCMTATIVWTQDDTEGGAAASV